MIVQSTMLLHEKNLTQIGQPFMVGKLFKESKRLSSSHEETGLSDSVSTYAMAPSKKKKMQNQKRSKGEMKPWIKPQEG